MELINGPGSYFLAILALYVGVEQIVLAQVWKHFGRFLASPRNVLLGLEFRDLGRVLRGAGYPLYFGWKPMSLWSTKFAGWNGAGVNQINWGPVISPQRNEKPNLSSPQITNYILAKLLNDYRPFSSSLNMYLIAGL
jgi:hypothetical protein